MKRLTKTRFKTRTLLAVILTVGLCLAGCGEQEGPTISEQISMMPYPTERGLVYVAIAIIVHGFVSS
ncbi:hypothetical protein KAR91_12595 [Candidatus Pacearchaeota archaeon]|nr:hypothetical protein [Candidatus Pacearchaeota archaeon]